MEGRENARKKVKIIDEMDCERLSNLPNPIIYHILSLMDTKYAVQTCVLSKKRKLHWTQVHSLDFDHKSFKGKVKFGKFVHHVLRQRRPFNLCKLRFRSRGERDSAAAERILNYTKSKNVEELETNSCVLRVLSSEFPTLRTIRLFNTVITNSFHPASLTTLHLFRVWFYFADDIFSSCLNLENLILDGCHRIDLEVIKISAPRLVNLNMSSFKYRYREDMKLLISAPRLKSFNFNGMYLLLLGIDECAVLEKVQIHMLQSVVYRQTEDWMQEQAFDMVRMAERLSHAKSLKISGYFTKGKFILNRHQSKFRN